MGKVRKLSRRRKIAVIDAETDPFRHGRVPKPFLWGYYDGEQYLEFEREHELVEFLADQRVLVYAHNGGKFDFHFLWDYMDEGEELTVINGRIVKFRIGDCEFRDSFALLPVSLAAMQKDKIDYKIFEEGERDKPENLEAIREYLRSDCVYLHEWLTRFVDEYGLHLTLAGTALKVWQKISGTEAPRDEGGELYSMLRGHYYGGRCESFHYGELGALDGKARFRLADINSAYPYAMLSMHPLTTLPSYGAGAREWNALPAAQRRASFVTVRGIAKGCFPFRLDDGSLVFPNDDTVREYKITGWEYEAAKDTRTFECREFAEFIYFEELHNFSDYINHFYNMKKQAKADGNASAYLFAKLFMNSLYGKFGANPDEYREYMTAGYWQLDDEGNAGEWQFNGEIPGSAELCIVSRPQPDEKQKFYNIATAASITGFVRAFLWRAICRCEGVLYCDTDSIAALDVSGLDYGAELGQWELEGEFDYGAFAGRKLYAMHYRERPERFAWEGEHRRNWKIASKGVKATPDDLRKVATGGEFLYQPQAPTFSLHRSPTFVPRTVRMQRKKVAP